jgi:hypothetical protein
MTSIFPLATMREREAPMLAYLLDENISAVVAERLAARNCRIPVRSIYHWREGGLVGEADLGILLAARQDGLTLVTYDLRTIPGLLTELAADNEDHAGVVLVDDQSVRSDDFGGIVRALEAHWEQFHGLDWTNRMSFLAPHRG